MHDKSIYHKPFDAKLSFPFPSLLCVCQMSFIHENFFGKAVFYFSTRGYVILPLEGSLTAKANGTPFPSRLSMF